MPKPIAVDQIWEEARGVYDEAVAVRRRLHKHPELSFKEYDTTQYLKSLLQDAGIELLDNPLETGLAARIRGEKPGKQRVLLKADIDALPLQEINDVSYRSEVDGVMHACGHDMHTALLVAVLKILKKMQAELPGEVIAIFQPGEELLPGGARKYADSGFFEQYPPDVALAMHAMPDFNSGTAGFHPGNYMASGDEVYITITGKGGHAGLPHTVADPVYAAAQVVTALQQVTSRNAPPEIPTVIAFGKIAGGTTMNIIPDNVELEGTFRTFNEQWRVKARERIEQIARLTAEAAGTTAEVNIVEGYPTLFNHPETTNKVMQWAREAIGELHVVDMNKRMTTDDFAVFSQLFPSVYMRLGTHNPHWNEKRSLHAANFDIDERTMYNGVAVMTWSIVNLLHR